MRDVVFWGVLAVIIAAIIGLGAFSIEGKAAQERALQDRLDAMEARIEALEALEAAE